MPNRPRWAGAILHLGATSMDIEDNADVLRLRQALDLVLEKLDALLLLFAEKIEAWADTPLMAFTHLQPAEPSTLGYRLALLCPGPAAGLAGAWTGCARDLRGKGFKGAVGTGAAYAELLGGSEQLAEFRSTACPSCWICRSSRWPARSTRASRITRCSSALAGLGGSLYKFAFDLRFLQSPPVGELSEPFGKQAGGLVGHALQAQPDQRRKDRFAGPPAGPGCRAWPGITPPIRCSSAPWTTRPTGAPCCRKPF